MVLTIPAIGLLCLAQTAHVEPATSSASASRESIASTDEASPQVRWYDDVARIIDVKVHGFVSQGALKSTSNDYLGRSQRGTLAFSEVGINFTQQLLDDLRTDVQLFARHLDGNGDLSARFDWYYLDWRFRDWLGVRVGRLKVPFGLYNEFNDIDAGRVPILLPEGVYPIQNRDFLLAQTGFELYGYVSAGGAGGLEYRLYGGTLVFDDEETVSDGFRLDRIEIPFVAGGRLVWDTPVQGLRLALTGQALRLESAYVAEPGVADALKGAGLAPSDFDGRLNVEISAALWLASIEFTRDDLLIAAEYGRWHVRFDGNVPTLFPAPKINREQFYLMTTYRLSDLVSPGVYYSALFPDVSDRTSSRARYQHDVAFMLRLDLNPFWLFKVEGHYLRGTAYLSSEDNGGRSLEDLEETWWLVAAKTTLYF